MNISELKANQKKIEVQGELVEISDVREFSKFGKVGRVASSVLKDESGQVQLTLWDEQLDAVKEGDTVKIVNGYVKEWQGELQLNVGRFGNLEVIK